MAVRQPRHESAVNDYPVEVFRISFIGAGKVSGALCRKLYSEGCKIGRIVSRTEKKGQTLAHSCNSVWSDEYDFEHSDNLIIVAVADDELPRILKKIRCAPETLVAHTAGTLGLDIFPPQIKHKGVFYPLQTFSENHRINFRNLPLFLETSDDYSTEILLEIGRILGAKSHFTDTEHRRMLHVAAVFVNNFTNYMLTAGKQVAATADFPFDVLEPLIKETVSKALRIGPENAQTGPAVRFDEGTIKKHIDLLSFSPEFQRVYKELTRSMISYYKSSR